MLKNENNSNISYLIEESECDNNKINIQDLIDEINKINKINDNDIQNDDLSVALFIDYKLNYTLKELLLICDYYGISKELKINKFNKYEIIQFLVYFESREINSIIVSKRRKLWFYINELKKDKFMKKFILWS